MKLRNYRREARAEAYAKVLRSRFPDTAFKVESSTLMSYPFTYLIRATKTDGSSAWVTQ